MQPSSRRPSNPRIHPTRSSRWPSCLLLLALLAPAGVAEALTPRPQPVKPAHTVVDPDVHSLGAVLVKFIDDLDLQLSGEKLLEADTGVSAVDGAMPAGGTWRRVYGEFSVEELDAFRADVQGRSGAEISDLANWLVYELAQEATAQDLSFLIDSLNAQENVEVAVPEGRLRLAWSEDPVTEKAVSGMAGGTVPDFEPQQHYIQPDPNGLQAIEVWDDFGVTGAGVEVFQSGWAVQVHDDYPTPEFLGTPGLPPTGEPFLVEDLTAQLGIMAAQRNGFGTTGMAHGATYLISPVIHVLPPQNGDLAATAASILRPVLLGAAGAGDIIEIPWTYQEGVSVYPLDYEYLSYDAIRSVSQAGVTVVESAARSSKLLDLEPWGTAGHFPWANRSGSIIVGAGQLGTDTRAHPSSNVGSAVDLQAPGYGYATTGWGDYWDDPAYTVSYPYGEAAAVAGAAALVQSANKIHCGQTLTPAELRAVLMSTGRPSQSLGIGPRPLARSAILATCPEAANQPEPGSLQVRDPSGAAIPPEGTFDFGTVAPEDEPVEAVFTAVNTGESDFHVTSFDVTGDGFSATSSPVGQLLEPGESVSFGVELDPTGLEEGPTFGAVTLSTDEASPPTFSFHLEATVSEDPNPPSGVWVVASVDPPDVITLGSSFDCCAAVLGDFAVKHTFVIDNTDGDEPLEVSNFVLVNTLGFAFSLEPPSSPTVIPAHGSETFRVEMETHTLGERLSADIFFDTDDPSRPTFFFEVTGQVVEDALTVRRGEFISPGDDVFLGVTGQSDGESWTFVIENLAQVSLLIRSSARVEGDFQWEESPVLKTIPSGETRTFSIRLKDLLDAGQREGEVILDYFTTNQGNQTFNFYPHVSVTASDQRLQFHANVCVFDNGIELFCYDRPDLVYGDQIDVGTMQSGWHSLILFSVTNPSTLNEGTFEHELRSYGAFPTVTGGPTTVLAGTTTPSTFLDFAFEPTVEDPGGHHAALWLTGTHPDGADVSIVVGLTGDYDAEDPGDPEPPAPGEGVPEIELTAYPPGPGSTGPIGNGTTFTLQPVLAGFPTTQSFLIRNVGDGMLLIQDFGVENYQEEEVFQEGSLPQETIAPGASRAFSILVHPPFPGAFEGNLAFFTNTSQGAYTIDLEVDAVAEPQIQRPRISLTQGGAPVLDGSHVQLPPSVVGSGVVRDFQIANEGDVTLRILGFEADLSPGLAVENAPGEGFLIFRSTPHTFSVRAMAAAPGPVAGTITLETNDPLTPELTFTISGQVLDPGGTGGVAQMVLTPVGGAPLANNEEFHFPEFRAPGTRLQAFVVSNPSDVDLEIDLLEGPEYPFFDDGPPLPAVIPPGGSAEFTVRNAPSSGGGPRRSEYVWRANIPAGTFTLRLVSNHFSSSPGFPDGEVRNAEGGLVEDGAVVDLGSLALACPVPRTFRIVSTGDLRPLDVHNFNLTGGDFQLPAGTLPPEGLLFPGESDPFTVELVPDVSPGPVDGRVSFTTNLSTTPIYDFELTGDAVDVPPCTPSAHRLCLQDGRFTVTLEFVDHINGNVTGQGKALPSNERTGYFWFFRESNVEVAVKVLDGTPVNDHFWVFHGGLTTLAYTLTVADAVTDRVKVFQKPRGSLCGSSSTNAFAGDCSVPETGGLDSDTGGTDAFGIAADASRIGPVVEMPGLTACEPGPDVLCLQSNRFRVEVDWHDPNSSTSGVGQAQPMTQTTGRFSFFNPNNVELLVKILDARPIDGYFWVFLGSLSNVEYTVTITDTQTEVVRTYTNAFGTYCGQVDTAAFNDAGDPPQAPSLQVEAGIELRPRGSSEDYGVTGVGQPVSTTFTLRNTGSMPLSVSDVRLAGGSGGFSLVDPSPVELAPGASHSVAVKLDATAPGSFTRDLEIASDDPAGPYPVHLAGTVETPEVCEPDATTLCLRNGRFQVTLHYIDHHNGGGGAAKTTDYSNRTGLFWFFNPSNIEVVVKVLGPESGHWWVFHGGLTDLAYTLTVRDMTTGQVRTYQKAAGSFCGGGDTAAFPDFGLAAPPAPSEGTLVPIPAAGLALKNGSCTPGPSRLCLLDGRFALEAEYGSGQSAKAVPFNDRTGFFWFFHQSNLELPVKMLNGTPVNGYYWVFLGSMTHVGYTVRITDTATGAVQEYQSGTQFCGQADTTAFPAP